jgi:hypothetical protein
MTTQLDAATLANVRGGVRPGPNGEGCTQHPPTIFRPHVPPSIDPQTLVRPRSEER